MQEGEDGGLYYVSGDDDDDEDDGDDNDGSEVETIDSLPETDKVETSVDLDEPQAAYISDYRAGSSKLVNEVLRGSREMNDKAERIINSVSSAIEEAGEFDETTVYRGLEAPPDLVDRFAEGDTVRLNGFQSSSHDPSTAANFARTPEWDEEREDIVMEIETTRGFPAYETDALGEGIEADELILGHGWEYRVESVESLDGKTKVQMKVIGGEGDD